jgi:hypothetical protein
VKNWKQLISELRKAGIETEFKTKGNTDEIQGVRFQKNGYLYNGSKADKMFSCSKIDYQLNQNAKQEACHSQHNLSGNTVQNSAASTIETAGSILGGLLAIQLGNGYNEEEAEFQRLLRKKKTETEVR